MVHVCNTVWRIKNQPSNSTSCSDSAVHLLVPVAGILYWGLQVTSSFSNLGLRYTRLFWERFVLKGQIAFEGHYKLQYWTLVWCLELTRLHPKFKLLRAAPIFTISIACGVLSRILFHITHDIYDRGFKTDYRKQATNRAHLTLIFDFLRWVPQYSNFGIWI